MGTKAKQLIQDIEDKKNVKQPGEFKHVFSRDEEIQRIFNKLDNNKKLTDEEFEFWKSLSKEDKLMAMGAFQGANMNMQETHVPDDIEPKTHDYSELAPETEPKDIESEKVFNPSKPEEQPASEYDTLVMAVQNLKKVGVAPDEIKRALKSAEGYDKSRQISIPVWDKEGLNIIDNVSANIDHVIDDLAGKQLTKEQIAHSEELIKEARQKEEELHQQRIEALPENQARSAEEQTRTLDTHNKEAVNPDKSDEAAILARQPEDMIMVKNLENLLGDNAYAETLRDIVVDGKTKGKTFNEIILNDIGQKHLANIAKHTNNDTDKSSEILKYLGSIYDNTKTDKKQDIKQALDRKETRALKAGKRAEDKLYTAMANLESPGDLSVTPGRGSSSAAKFMRGNNKTQYNRLLSGDSNQEARQALKNAVQNPKAVESLLQDGRLNRVLNKFGSKVNRSPEYWLNYFKDNPYLSFRIVPSKAMRDDATLNFVGEREGHGNGGKEDPFNLMTGDEIDNFLTAYNKVSELNDLKREAMKKFNKSFKSVNNDDNFAPINTPAFNFVSDSGVDAQEDAEFRARFKKMLQTGDKRWMYQDPSRDTITYWDPETGLLTEEKISDAVKSIKEHKTGYTIDDNYYKRLLNELSSDFSTLQDALDYTSGNPGEGNPFNAMESGIRNNLGNDAVGKAKNLLKDIMSFAGVLSGKDMSKLDGKSILKSVLPFGGALSTTTLRQLQNKFNGLRNQNATNQFLKTFEDTLKDVFPSEKALPSAVLSQLQNKLNSLRSSNIGTQFPDLLKSALPSGKALSDTTLRQLQNKFNDLRNQNTAAPLSTLLKGGDWLYDTLANGLGYDIEESLDPRWYKDFVSGQAKVNNWRKKREDSIKSMIDSDKLKRWLKYNLDELKRSLDSGDYSRFGKDLDDTDMQVLIGRFNDALMRLYSNDDKEKAVRDMSKLGTAEMPTLAELYSDKYNSLKDEYADTKQALAELIKANGGKADTPDITKHRGRIDEISSELARMKYEKVPIRELADLDFGGDYSAAEQSYLQSEEEDDLDKWYNTVLNKVALTNKMHNLSKEEPDKYASILGILNNIAESYPTSFPGMSKWIDMLSNYKDPGKLNDILKSQKASAEMLGLTPEEFSALENNRSAKNSKRQSASLRHRLVGQRKARGSMGSDAYNRADQVADIIQKAENIGNIDKLLDIVGHEDSAGLAEAKQDFADSSATLKALLDGIFADTPGDNNGR